MWANGQECVSVCVWLVPAFLKVKLAMNYEVVMNDVFKRSFYSEKIYLEKEIKW